MSHSIHVTAEGVDVVRALIESNIASDLVGRDADGAYLVYDNFTLSRGADDQFTVQFLSGGTVLAEFKTPIQLSVGNYLVFQGMRGQIRVAFSRDTQRKLL